jgi:hypothetical protein
MRIKAGLIGEGIRRENGVGEAIRCVYRDIGFARESIEVLRKRNEEAAKERSGVVGRGIMGPVGLVRFSPRW